MSDYRESRMAKAKMGGGGKEVHAQSTAYVCVAAISSSVKRCRATRTRLAVRVSTWVRAHTHAYWCFSMDESA